MYFNKLVSFVILYISPHPFINTQEGIFVTGMGSCHSVWLGCAWSLQNMEQVCLPCVHEEGVGGWKTTSLLSPECLGFSLGFLHMLPPSILKTILWSRYYPHFTRRTDSWSNLPKVTASKPWNIVFLTLAPLLWIAALLAPRPEPWRGACRLACRGLCPPGHQCP